MIRKTAWSIAFLKSVWVDFPSAIDHEWWDTQAIRLYKESHRAEFDQHAEILPWNRFNSMGEGWYCPGGGYAPGDFVRHLAGQFVDFDLEELNKNETDYNNNKYEFLFRKLMGPESKCCQASCELAVSLLTGGL